MSRPAPAQGSILISNGSNGVGQILTNLHYPNMKTEKRPFVEFPKWVNMPGYESVLVDDAEAEAVLLARPARQTGAKPKIVSSNPVRIVNGIVQNPPTVRIPTLTPKTRWERFVAFARLVIMSMSY